MAATSCSAASIRLYRTLRLPLTEEGRPAYMVLLRGFSCLAIVWFTLWNGMKIPFYKPSELPMTNVTYNAEYCTANPDDRSCWGLELAAQLGYWTGQRAEKLLASPTLFVAPHCAMGIALMMLMLLALLEPHTLLSRTKAFAPLALAFALHILPVVRPFYDTVPDRMYDLPLNLLNLCMMFLGLGALAAAVSLLRYPWAAARFTARFPARDPLATGRKLLLGSWIWVSLWILSAPILEMYFLSQSQGDFPVEGNEPHPDSGRAFYSGCGCPGFGWFITVAILVLTFGYIGTYVAAKAMVDSNRSYSPTTRRYLAYITMGQYEGLVQAEQASSRSTEMALQR